MPESLVRVAVVSRSPIVRSGVVALIGELGERAIVVDTLPRDKTSADFDVAIVDLDAADQRGISEELRHVAALGAPVIGLVYAPGNATPPTLGRLPILTLNASGADLWNVLDSIAIAAATTGPRRSDALGLPDGLTQRELEILRLIVNGASNKEIAAKLYLSVNSVKTYIRTGYRKTGVTNRSTAVLWGVQHGLIVANDASS